MMRKQGSLVSVIVLACFALLAACSAQEGAPGEGQRSGMAAQGRRPFGADRERMGQPGMRRQMGAGGMGGQGMMGRGGMRQSGPPSPEQIERGLQHFVWDSSRGEPGNVKAAAAQCLPEVWASERSELRRQYGEMKQCMATQGWNWQRPRRGPGASRG